MSLTTFRGTPRPGVTTIEDFRRQGRTVHCPHCGRDVEMKNPQNTSTCGERDCRLAQNRAMYAKRKSQRKGF